MPKLIGNDESDSRIQVPAIAVAQQPTLPEGVAPQAPQPGTNQVPKELLDSLAAPSGEFNGAVAPQAPIEEDLQFTLPDATPDPFQGAEQNVQNDLAAVQEQGKYVIAPDQLQPLSYGLSQKDQQLMYWADQQRAQTYNWQPQELPAVQGREPQALDPSVAGGFKPTSQDKPWWGDFEPTTEWNPLKGKFGDFGSGLLPGIFQGLSTAQAATQGIASDIARVGAGIVGGLDRIGVKADAGDAFKNVWNLSRVIARDPLAVGKTVFDGAVNSLKIATRLPDFAKGFQDNYSRLSPVATGQKPLGNLPANNGLQKLRNQSFFVSGLTGRNLSATDQSVDEKGRFNPLGQRQADNEKQKPTVISNVGARLSAEAASVTSFATGQGFLSKQQKESVYQDVRTSQIGGFARGLAVDVISGEVLERLASTVVKKGVNTFVRRVGKPVTTQLGKEAAEQGAKEAAEVIAKKPIVVGAQPDWGQIPVKPPSNYVAPQYRDERMWMMAQNGKKTPERKALPPTSSSPDRVFVVKPSGVFEVGVNGDAKKTSLVGIFKDGDLQPLPGEPLRYEPGVAFKEDTTRQLAGNDPLALPEQSSAPKRTFINDQSTLFNPKAPTRVQEPPSDALTGQVTDAIPGKKAVDLGEATSRSVGQVADTPIREIETVIPEEIVDVPVTGMKATDELVAEAPTNVATRNVAQLRRETPIAEAQVYDPERYLDEWAVFVTPEAVDAISFKVLPQQFLEGRVAPRAVEGFRPTALLNESTRTIQVAGGFSPKGLLDTPTTKFDPSEAVARVIPGTPIEPSAIDVAAQDITEKRLMGEAPQRILDEYQEVAPGLFIKAAPIDKEVMGGASTAYPSTTGVVHEVLGALPGTIAAEVFSPQLSLGELADLVTKQVDGLTYNPAMVKRGQRKLDSMVSLAQKVILPDGSPMIPSGSNGINTWAKLYNRINFATAGLSKEDADAFKRIFTRDGVPLPNEIPDTFAVQIRAPKVDTPEIVSVVSYKAPEVKTYQVDPSSLQGQTKKGWAEQRLEKLKQTGNANDFVEPDLTRDKVALGEYQKDLPNNLVSKTREGVKLMNERLITENEIAHLSEQARAAKKDLATISRQVDDTLTKLDDVPDAAPRTLLSDPNKESLDDLFMDAERIGNKYQTPEERQAFQDAMTQQLSETSDIIDNQFPDTQMEVADFKPQRQKPVATPKGMKDPTSNAQKKTAELRAKMEAYKAAKATPTEWGGATKQVREKNARNQLKGMGIKWTPEEYSKYGEYVDEMQNRAYKDGFTGTAEEMYQKYLLDAKAFVDKKGSASQIVLPQGLDEMTEDVARKMNATFDRSQSGTSERVYYKNTNDIPNVSSEEVRLYEELSKGKAEAITGDFYHGTRVVDVDYVKVDPVLSEPRGDLGVGIYVSKSADEATANAMAEVKRNTPPVEDRVYGAANVSTMRIKPDANIVDANSVMTPEVEDIFKNQAERILGQTPDGDLAVAAYTRALEKKPHTIAQAYALIEEKLLKASKKLFGKEALDEADVLKWQRSVAVELRVAGIDGVSHKTGVAIYNPDVISLKKVTEIGDTLDTLEIAVHRFNADSLAVERHPDSAYLKASLAETKARVLGELQDKAEELVKNTDQLLDAQVHRLMDIDKTLKGLAKREAVEKQVIRKQSEESTYQSFKKELNKPGDTPCL